MVWALLSCYILLTPDGIIPISNIEATPLPTPYEPLNDPNLKYHGYEVVTPRDNNFVALTFDDSPSKYTEVLLKALERKNAKATFFLVGDKIDTYPDTVTKIVEQGHDIGNHTWSALGLGFATSQEAIEDISKTEEMIIKYAGRGAPWIRPPFNSISDDAVLAVGAAGYRLVFYDIDSGDFFNNQTKNVLDKISKAKAGDIILFHDGILSSDTLMKAIDQLREKGLEPVSLSQLLASDID
jgi:peptidoglycan/xylan/chitin deacetylase (PgdA/CDA1 family)